MNYRLLGSLAIALLLAAVLMLNGCAGLVKAGSQAVSALFGLSSNNINFGSVTVGKKATQSVSVSNTGSVALNITQATLSNSQFSWSGATLPMALGVGQSTSLTLAVTPSAAGTISGTLTVSGDSGSSPVVANLSATAVGSQPQISVSPTSISFGTVSTGSAGTSSLTLSNTGSANLTVSSLTATGSAFKVSGLTTPATIAAGQSAQATVTFTPTAAGAVSGSVTIASNDPNNSSFNVSLSGTGSTSTGPALTITPTSASFGNVTVGSPTTQTIQLGNTGTGTLSVTQVTATGSGFSTTGLTLPLSLAAGKASTFSVQFAPASAGAVTGSVSVVSNAPNSPATIALSGTGVAQSLTLSLSATTLAFGSVNDGSSSTLTETLTNTGNANVQVTGITESGAGFSLTGATTPVTLSPSQKMTFSVIFSPTAAGSDSATVKVTSTASGSPATITLSGTGLQASTHSAALSWAASTSSVSGYNVYRSTTNGSGYAKINSALVPGLTYTDSTVAASTTYYYVATAVDGSGEESTYSNQVTAAIP
jgi:hypothetical protein